MSRQRILVALAAVAAVILVAILANGSVQPDSALTQKDNGRLVNARVGDTLTVRLGENPTTGYLWRATASEGLTITRSDYTPDDRSGTLAGSGGMRTWTIKVISSGTQDFAAALHPPDTGAEPVSTFSVGVAAQ